MIKLWQAASVFIGLHSQAALANTTEWWGQNNTSGASVSLWGGNGAYVSEADHVSVSKELPIEGGREGWSISSGYADLSTGKLGGRGFSQALMYDTLRFSAPGKTEDDFFELPVRLSINGILPPHEKYGVMSQATFSFVLSDLGVGATWQNTNDGFSNTETAGNFYFYNASSGWSHLGRSTFEGIARINYEKPVFFSMSLYAAGADFSHTASIAIQMPVGTQVSSASNSFLSAAPVPEPESYAMLLAGIGLLGAFTSGRKKSI